MDDDSGQRSVIRPQSVTNAWPRGGLGLGVVAAALCAIWLLALKSDSRGSQNNASLSNADLFKLAINNTRQMRSCHVEMIVNMTSSQPDEATQCDVNEVNDSMKCTVGADALVTKIGSDTYTSLDGGKSYTKYTMEKAAGSLPALDASWGMFENVRPEDVDKVQASLEKGIPPTEVMGDEMVRRITGDIQVLRVLEPRLGLPEDATGAMDIWLSTGAMPFLRRVRYSGASAGTPIQLDITWTRINEPVQIQAPPLAIQTPITP